MKLSIISEINHPSEYTSIKFLQVAEQVKQQFESAIKEKNVDFQIDCPEEISFSSYPRLVEMVLTSLMENAIYYGSLRNARQSKIILKATVVKDQLEFSLEDNGIGIKDNIKPRLFEMFFKGHEESKGNGLGLYIVQKSILTLNGSIDVESKAGEFSKFIVRLPLKIKAPVEELVMA
jgi:signal transduction histidine kinase